MPGKAEFNGDNKPDYVLYNSLTSRLPVIAFAWRFSHEQIAWPVTGKGNPSVRYEAVNATAFNEFPKSIAKSSGIRSECDAAAKQIEALTAGP